MANKYIYGEDIVSIVFDEGSVYWAIKQMIDGKVVRKKDGRTIYESCSSNDRVRLLPEVAPFHTDLDCTISMEEFIAKNLLVSDFEIYQNPKLKHSFKVGDRIVAIDNPALDYIIEKLYSVGSMPYAALRDSEGTLYGLGLFEIDTKDISSLEYDLTLKYKAYEEPKFKSGDWVKNIYSNDVLFIEEVDHTNYRYLVRLLGCKSRDEHAFSTLHGFYELYSLKPDFSEAEEGDQAFAYGFGKATIAEIREKNFYKIIACSEKFRREYTNLGKEYSTDAHPLLFHSHDQAENYYKEVAYQDRLKDETDSN